MENSKKQTKKKENKRSLKLKEQEFVDKLIENDGNKTKTAREVFGIADPKYANVKAERLLQKPHVSLAVEERRATLVEALQKKGVSPEKIAEKIKLLLNAKRKVFKNNNASGEIEIVAEEPDYVAIDKGLSHAIKIHGVEDETPKKQQGNTYNFIFSQPVQEKIKVMDAEIKNLLTQDPDENTSEN